jgi:hypothetical protein
MHAIKRENKTRTRQLISFSCKPVLLGMILGMREKAPEGAAPEPAFRGRGGTARTDGAPVEIRFFAQDYAL